MSYFLESLQELTKALETSQYPWPSSQLAHGAALLVEDLEATMTITTFMCPLICTQFYLDRLLRNLRSRNIEYTLQYFPRTNKLYLFCTDIVLTVGNRKVSLSLT